jgi:hypothetical protein
VINQAPRYEDVWVSRGIAPRILNLGTRWRWVVSFKPRPIYPPGNSTKYPLDRRVGRPENRSGRGGEEKKSLTLPGIEPRPSRSCKHGNEPLGFIKDAPLLEQLRHYQLLKVKVKVKLSLCFNWAPRHGGVLGRGGIAPLILWPRH